MAQKWEVTSKSGQKSSVEADFYREEGSLVTLYRWDGNGDSDAVFSIATDTFWRIEKVG